MHFLQVFSVWLKDTLIPFGGFGLMLLAVGDSSFLSLPEVNDLLLMTFSISKPENMLFYAFMTTLGSVIGCCLLYAVGRKGGGAFLKKGFSDSRMLRIQTWYQKHGVLAVIIPSLLPPPMPFKIFVLSAGTFGISWPQFIASVAIGRGIRYFAEGFLAVELGPSAITFVRDNFGKIGVGLSILIVVGVLVFYARRRMRSAEA